MRPSFAVVAIFLAVAIGSDASAQSTPTPNPTPLAALQCYEMHRPPSDIAGIALTDVFGASIVTVKRAKRLCTPVDVDGQDPSAADAPAHLTAYTIKQTSPRFERVHDFTVTNQFGTFVVDLVRPDRILVPTAKSVSGLPAMLGRLVDHFKCYRVKGQGFHAADLSVQDQFGTTSVDLLKPLHVCAPADKNGEGLIDAATYLTCFQARGARPAFTGDVFTVDQFGGNDFRLSGPREDCFPSLEVTTSFVELSDAGRDPGLFSCIQQWTSKTCGGQLVRLIGDMCVQPGQPDVPVASSDFIREAYTSPWAGVACKTNQCCANWLRDPPLSCKTYCEIRYGWYEPLYVQCLAFTPASGPCAGVESAECLCFDPGD